MATVATAVGRARHRRRWRRVVAGLALLAMLRGVRGDSALRLTVVGRTGDGKSSFCNLLMRHFDPTLDSLFPESDEAKSQTGVPLTKTIDNIRITDTPGLVDTRGYQQDDENINTIVAHVKREEVNHGLLLVINEQAPRFDQAMQVAVQRLVASFGDTMLLQLGVVFTKAWHRSPRKSALFVENQIVPMIQGLNLSVAVPRLPSWQVDCHPDALEALNASTEFIQLHHENNRASVVSILRWLYRNRPMSTLEIAPAQNELQRELQEIKLALAEERRQRRTFEQKMQFMSSAAERLEREVDHSRRDQRLAVVEHLHQMLWLALYLALALGSAALLVCTGVVTGAQRLLTRLRPDFSTAPV